MSKEITPAVLASVEGETIDAFLLVKLEFDAATIRLNTTDANIQWDGETWIGAARLGSITGIEETEETEASGFKLTLWAGDFAALALGEQIRGRLVTVYFACRNTATGVVIDDPILLSSARMDRMPIQFGPQGIVELVCLSRWVDWSRARISRFTDAEQKSRFPGDRAFEQTAQTVVVNLPWGRA